MIDAQKLNCICSNIYVDYVIVVGLEQEDRSIITPKALARPLQHH